jgi:hypothetical protein
MPIPKVPNGLKLTLILPADMVLRVKTEAVQGRTQPSTIVQRALAAYWGETTMASTTFARVIPGSGASLGIRLTTRQKLAIRGRNLYALIQNLIAMKVFTEDQFLKALGISPSKFTRYWKPPAKVPADQLQRVFSFLEAHAMDDGEIKDAVRVPDFI